MFIYKMFEGTQNGDYSLPLYSMADLSDWQEDILSFLDVKLR